MTKRPILVLDLDETLINSEEVKYFNQKKYSAKMRDFKWKKMDNDFYVFERPHLQVFLDFAFENFEVSVWTAASKNYALWILEHILRVGTEKRPLRHFFFDYHCNASEKLGTGKKDLSILARDFKLTEYDMNTIIIDDNEEVYQIQPENCISIKEFQFRNENSEKDDELLKIIAMLKHVVQESA